MPRSGIDSRGVGMLAVLETCADNIYTNTNTKYKMDELQTAKTWETPRI